ncbi:MAG TPA: hypothetical protein PKE12_01595 [Kiritimatiellia bacterium]|nr:hypothetical protein [Kiritimatiellia bacterium]
MSRILQDESTREIGATQVGRTAARVFVSCVLLALLAVSALEWSASLPTSLSVWSGDWNTGSLWERNRALQTTMHAFEDRLREEAWLTRTLTPPLQRFKVRHLRLGTERVLIGRDGWLHFQPDVEHLTGRGLLRNHARIVTAVRDFADHLEARGIALVLMPVPVKTGSTGDTLRSGVPASHPLQPVAWTNLRDALEREGLTIFAPTTSYLRADTHWTFDAMDDAARELAEMLRVRFELPPPSVRFDRDPRVVEGVGDLARMLGDGWPPSMDARETQRIAMVRDGDHAWRSATEAPVLLLGDSFSNIFSQDALGWGEGAGLAEQLSFHLGWSVDRIVRNDAGAWATRDVLARELARGRDRLAGKRVVVWQFAAREFSQGDWRTIPLESGAAGEPLFLAPPREPVEWRGVVAAVSAVPVPRRVPYADHIASFHLVDVDGPGAAPGASAYVFSWSMTNHHRTAAGRARVGDAVHVRVRPWEAVSEALEGFNRSELDGDEFMQADIAWGEWLP